MSNGPPIPTTSTHALRPCRARLGVPAALLLLTVSCSTAEIHERYHVQGIRDGRVQNYYRIDVTGEVVGTKLRYLSGFFDEEALDRYFNTFAQPGDGALLQVEAAEQEEEEASVLANGETRDADPSGQHRKLVLLLSQNSDAVADQIGAIAQAQEFATVVGRSLFGDQLIALEEARTDQVDAQQQATSADASAVALAALLESTSALDGAGLRERLLYFLNELAAPFGESFADIKEAQTWLAEHRVQLAQGDL